MFFGSFSLTPLATVGWLIAAVLLVIPHYRLWKRTGHSGWWGLLILVPLINVIMLWTLALKTWPSERGTRASR